MTTTPAPVYGGRYELRSQIARGGTAQVYLARDLLLDRPVVLKVLFPELSTDHSFVERFRREAQAAANLMHPNIVQVFDWGESERTYFIVMEHIDGEPFSSIVRTQAPLPGPQAAAIVSDIAKALSYAHRHGVVHRDVKPGNVLITADGQVKVTDFGIARAIGSDEQVTQTGLVMGTATYFSPEQAQGLTVDAVSDVYALGVVLYEMLTGRPPFSGDTPVAIAYQHVREQPPAPRTLEPAIPSALEAIVLQAMAKLPAERYVTADEMKGDLDRFVHGQTVLARPPRATGSTGLVTTALPVADAGGSEPDTSAVGAVTGGRRARRPRRERSTTPFWVAGGVLLLVAIGLVVWFGGRSLGYFGGKTTVDVPAVTGRTEASAELLLRQEGLHAGRHEPGVSVTDLGDVGKVKSQDPRPGKAVAAGSTVRIVVWESPVSASVPGVVGKSQAAAVEALESAGFTYTVQPVEALTITQKQGSVLRESPGAGRSVPKGTRVTIYVVSGSKTVPVPKVAGESLIAATTDLTTAGFKVSPNTTKELSSVPAGDVISTSPAAGTPTPRGWTISLVVSKGSATVPFVIGETPQQAEQQVKQANLTYRTALSENVAPDDVGFVVETGPAPGTVVVPGREIVIYIGAMNGSTATTTTTTTTTTPATTTTTSTTTTTTTTTLPGTTLPSSVPTSPSVPGSGPPPS